MRKAFTLVELLIVVVVMVTLMSIAFRIGAIGSDSSRRDKTITRLQRLENCLSGYYAAYGSYPPVPLHGSRNYYLKVSGKGIQNVDGDENQGIFQGWSAGGFRHKAMTKEDRDREAEDWRQVQAACRAQPLGCAYPYPEGYSDYVDAWSDHLKEEAASSDSTMSQSQKDIFINGFDDGVSRNPGRNRAMSGEADWRKVQMFKFGLMSFFLPRYLLMLNAKDGDIYAEFKQWTANNSGPADPFDGSIMSWCSLRKKLTSGVKSDYARVANIPSQAICSRWLPNLQGIVDTVHTSYIVFGVDLRDPEGSGGISASTEVYSPGGYSEDSSSSQYVLDGCTVKDGWGTEFFYYSPAPYQTYVLWSAGPNARTFPPWVARDKLSASDNEHVNAWTEDDIVNLSH